MGMNHWQPDLFPITISNPIVFLNGQRLRLETSGGALSADSGAKSTQPWGEPSALPLILW